MLENFDSEIKLLTDWYQRTKEVVIVAESIDSEGLGFLQPMHEQRYSLDHFIRAINYQTDEKKTRQALMSAVGHLQRGYSDAIEWLLMSVYDQYIDTMEQYSNSQILQCFPEYYKEIKPSLNKIKAALNEYKTSKSIEETTSIEIDIMNYDELEKLSVVTDQFLSENVVEKLQSYLKMLNEREYSLIEAKEKDEQEQLEAAEKAKKDKRKSFVIKDLLIPSLVGVAVTVVGGIILGVIN